MTRIHASQTPSTAATAPIPVSASRGHLQRCGGVQCPPGPGNHDDQPWVHRHTTTHAPTYDAPPVVTDLLDGRGESLDPLVEARMSARFGHDFGAVRIHTGAVAADAANAVNPDAFPSGRPVVMGEGKYRPSTPAGARPLVHELVHTRRQAGPVPEKPWHVSSPADPAERAAEGPPSVQRKTARSRPLQTSHGHCACGGGCAGCAGAGFMPSLEVSTPGDAREREADRVAEAVTAADPIEAAGPGPMLGTSSPVALIQRCGPGAEDCDRDTHEAASASRPGARWERETDRTSGATFDAPLSESAARRRITAPGSLGRHADQGAIQRCGDTPPESCPCHESPSVSEALRSSSSSLDDTVRLAVEHRLSHDFSKVRVHTGASAAKSAHQLGALAYTVGNDIIFGAGRYAPATREGRRLMAHELVHVMQQTAVPQQRIQRQAPDTGKTGKAPASRDLARVPASMSVSLAGIQLIPPDDAVFARGERLPQLLGMALRRLTADVVSDAVVTACVDMVVAANFPLQGNMTGVAKAGEKAPHIFTLEPSPAMFLVAFLQERKLKPILTDKQRELLLLGVGASGAWQVIDTTQVAQKLGIALPKWFSRGLFLSEAGSHGTELAAFAAAWRHLHDDQRPDSPGAKEARTTLRALVDAIRPNVDILEAIRTDAALLDTLGYALLWPLPDTRPQGAAKGAQATAAPRRRTKPVGPAEAPDPQSAALFLAWAHTQPKLADNAADDPEARKELLVRFGRFSPAPSVGAKDQRITATPGGANAPAWPSTLVSSPALAPPLFEAALGTDHTFVMQIQFATVFDAFATYAYRWERVRAPEQARKGEKQKEPVSEKPSRAEVASARYSRVARYNEEDVRRVINDVGAPAGLGALQATEANNIFRYVGATFRLGFEILTSRADEKQVVFPEQGIYVVRCSAIPISSDNAEVLRPPSVAYLPVLARDPQAIAERQTKQAVADRGLNMARLSELRYLLEDGGADLPERKELAAERDDLETTLGPIETNLQKQKKALEQRRDSLTEGTSDRRDVERQLMALGQRLQVRQKREEKHGLKGAEAIQATFVADLGHTVALVLEANAVSSGVGEQEYYVSDLTTPNSGDATAKGPDRPRAIMKALREILEGTAGYGRGQLSVSIDGTVYNARIAASTGSIMMEAVDTLVMIASIAAVAAAPFTGGASLMLLVPIGLVGAIPSAYRLANRAQMGTLRLDLAAAMDVVNIVGGIIGLGQAVTPLTYVRLGGAIMITGIGAQGLGVMLMGAQLVEQIEELRDLPAGIRAARMMEILGNAMVQAGIMVGTALAEHSRAAKTEAGAHFVDGEAPLSTEVMSGAAGSEHGAEGKTGKTGPGGSHTEESGGNKVRTDEPGLLAVGPSKDGLHEVKITKGGKVAVCSFPCQFLRDRFPNEIDKLGLRDKIDALEGRIDRTQQELTDGKIDQATHDAQIEVAYKEATDLEASLRAERQPYLDLDLTKGKANPQEGQAGMHLEDLLGRPVERSPHEGADFIDNTGRRNTTYDALGPVPPGHFDSTPGEFAAWAKSLQKHLAKTGLDFIFLDLSGLFPAQRVRALTELGNQLAKHGGKPAVKVYP